MDRRNDDMKRLPQYAGAVNDNGDITLPAPGLVVSPFWTSSFCSITIRAAEISGLWDNPDGVPSAQLELSLRALSPRLFAQVEKDVRDRIWPRLGERLPWPADARLYDAVVIRRAGGAGCDGQVQYGELATGRGSVRLNDGYWGGALLFPRQAWDDEQVPVGALMLWPPAGTGHNRIELISRGTKYRLELRWR